MTDSNQTKLFDRLPAILPPPMPKPKRRGGQSLDQSFKDKEHFIVLVQDCYSRACSFKSTHAQILQDLATRVWANPKYKRLPAWAKSEVSGYHRAKMDALYRYELEWRVSLDGELRLSKEVDLLTKFEAVKTNRPEKTPWQRVDPDEGRFVWKSDRCR